MSNLSQIAFLDGVMARQSFANRRMKMGSAVVFRAFIALTRALRARRARPPEVREGI